MDAVKNSLYETNRTGGDGKGFGKIKPEDIALLQERLYENLVCFADFCEKHNIVYHLAGGTCIGAVRDNYFIPRKDEAEQTLAELVKQYPLRYMAPTQILDTKGRPQSVIGSYESDPDGNLVMHITEKLNLGTHFLGIAIN